MTAYLRRHRLAAIIIAAATLLVAVAALGSAAGEPSDATPAAQLTAGQPVFDPADWEAFVAGGSVPASVASVIRSLSWNGVALVAETSIHPDADAEAAARGVCSALSGFWLTHGGFRPVQVVGTDGGVLVSRATLADQCSWRRD